MSKNPQLAAPLAGRPPILADKSSSGATSTRPSLSRIANNAGTPGDAFTVATSGNNDLQTYNRATYEPNGSYWSSVQEESMLENYASELDLLAPDLWGPADSSTRLPGVAPPNSEATIMSPRSSVSPVQAKTSNGLNVESPQSSTSWSLRTPSSLKSCNCFLGILTATQHISEYANTNNPALDSVLCANRAAAKHCFTSLHCANSVDSVDNISCTTIACGLLDRILVSYKAALNSFSANLEREGMGTQSQNEDEYEDRAAVAGAVKLRLGKFAIDNSDQELCARKIVAREIVKLRTAVEGNPKKDGHIRSVLLEHVIRQCTSLIDDITD